MFVTILVSTHRAAQRDQVLKDFQSITVPIRDLRFNRDRTRDIEFFFSTDRIDPFLDYAKDISTRDYVKDNIEFAYDDGNFRSYFISEGLVDEEPQKAAVLKVTARR